MSGFTTDEKVNLLFKKLLGKPSTKHNNPYFQEPSKINTTNINVRPSVIVSKQLYLDNIPDTAPTELLNITTDDLNNSIEGSIIGKSSNNKIIKKYVKIPFQFIPGSAIGVHHILQSHFIYLNYKMQFHLIMILLVVIYMNYMKIMVLLLLITDKEIGLLTLKEAF